MFLNKILIIYILYLWIYIQKTKDLISCREFPEIILSRKFSYVNIYSLTDLDTGKTKKNYQENLILYYLKYHVIIFINGCFWHGHTCRAGRLPETNHAFWENKIHKNILRDKKNIQELETRGWKVIVIWECELKNTTLTNNRLTLLISEIKSNLA